MKFIYCNNARENRTLEKIANKEKQKFNIQFKYKARATPQQNILVETRLLLISVNILYLQCYKIIQKAVIIVTKLDRLVIITINREGDNII